jgi:hypothetical protein
MFNPPLPLQPMKGVTISFERTRVITNEMVIQLNSPELLERDRVIDSEL